uniref:Uncharacterized protein n=1 Tax=Amphimedon queenslandica TaxID=400682 RepID=A0A1X7T8U6_AMPQE
MNFIRCQYSFTILRSAIRCIRGTRHRGKVVDYSDFDRVASDAYIAIFWKKPYEQRVREVEHSSFTPLIFSTSGGCSPLTTSFLKRLSLLYTDKFNRPYHSTMNFIRCQYSFTILRSAIRCIRGTRHCGKVVDYSDFDRAASDTHI